MLMAVDQRTGPGQAVKRREAAAKTLQSVYRTFSFVNASDENLNVRIVKAFVRVPKQNGVRFYGGNVEQRDFVKSIDPVRFRVRRALEDNSIKIPDLVLEEVHPGPVTLKFIFAPKKQTKS